MRPFTLAIPPYAAGNATDVAAAQNLSGGGVQRFDLTGGARYDASVPRVTDGLQVFGAVVMDAPRQVLFTSVGDDSGIRFVVRGRGRKGNRIVEAVQGANAGTALTQNAFLVVDEVLAEGDTAGNVSVGTQSVVSTSWAPMDDLRNPVSISLGLLFGDAVGGNLTVELTLSDLGFQEVNAGSDFARVLNGAINPIDHDTLVAQTADAAGNVAFPIAALRLTSNAPFTSATDTPVQLEVRQAAHRGA